jgi:hypothetical protein
MPTHSSISCPHIHLSHAHTYIYLMPTHSSISCPHIHPLSLSDLYYSSVALL